ncbi:50S ribosomal subunit protein L15 [Blumeria hordei DH14]|uniref:50S ribosomal subunit protein L15 n=1 Tax=Blumeria graminis f. sp. hordei (strain DH14) TaxID=546991 RepID=N1J6B6_BLUG1|nr:50S ribosomal subunit protein L15 [Blumeria hordei DH14]
MAPTLPSFLKVLCALPFHTHKISRPTTPLLSFVQSRSASILGSLSDNPGSYKKRIRRGRGPSSGKGKTSGRGHKGQKAHGKVPAKMQGGQTALDVVHGERGFDNIFSPEMSRVNLDRIQSWIDQGRIDPSKLITLKELVQSRCIHGIKDGVKLLARGKEELKTPIKILVSRASATAIEAVEQAGGTVVTRYYTKHSIRRLLNGESESSSTPIEVTLSTQQALNATLSSNKYMYRLPDPTSRKDLEYYRDSSKRGYLSHLVAEGHGPSLFFKTPGTKKDKKKQSIKSENVKVSIAGENTLW